MNKKTIRVKVAPKGEHETHAGIEVFREDGCNEAIKTLKGSPCVFHGFPNHAVYKDTYPDIAPKGRVRKLFWTEYGLEADITLTEAGWELVSAGGFHAADCGRFRSLGNKRWLFVGLESIGLTKNPALPIPAIVL